VRGVTLLKNWLSLALSWREKKRVVKKRKGMSFEMGAIGECEREKDGVDSV